MSSVVIGIDTSCYTTSAAAVTTEGQVLVSSRKLLPVAEGNRGLRQSEMVFLHTKQLPDRIREVADAIRGEKIAAVCVSSRPRDDESSYMPAFLTGDAQARGLAAVLGIPCFESTHQRGHVRAALVDSGIRKGNLLAVHLSGGTTEILSLRGEALTLLGGSLDLHAGQVVDRTGVALGLPFPAGPHLENLALKAQPQALLKTSMAPDGISCHLSGAEAQIRRWIDTGEMSREQIAAEVYDVTARTVCRMITAAAEKTGIRQVLVAGGVASSAILRNMLQKRLTKADRTIHLCFGKPEYSGDNAVGIALIGADKLRGQKA